MQIGFIVILIMAIFVAIFAIQNGTPVPIDLFFARYEMPLAVIMMICLILGAIMVLILGTTRQFKKRSEQKELKNKIKTIEGEKTQIETNIKTLETEKAELAAKIEAFEAEKQTLQGENTGFIEKLSQFEDKIRLLEEELTEKDQEIERLKIQNIDEFQEDVEITDEGSIETNNENSEAESQ